MKLCEGKLGVPAVHRLRSSAEKSVFIEGGLAQATLLLWIASWTSSSSRAGVPVGLSSPQVVEQLTACEVERI